MCVLKPLHDASWPTRHMFMLVHDRRHSTPLAVRRASVLLVRYRRWHLGKLDAGSLGWGGTRGRHESPSPRGPWLV